MQSPLRLNGLAMPADFPAAPFERVQEAVSRQFGMHENFGHFAAGWNAVSYRYVGACRRGDDFASSLAARGPTPAPPERALQECALFDFFSGSFSALEATFYSLYAVGAFLSPATFPIKSEKDQQRVSPSTTTKGYRTAFGDDPFVVRLECTIADVGYMRIRETRNILTHRTAPGRTIYVGIGAEEDDPPVEWKLTNQRIDENLVLTERRNLAELLLAIMDAAVPFIESRAEGR
jgi:hypothetical protein